MVVPSVSAVVVDSEVPLVVCSVEVLEPSETVEDVD